MSTNLFKRLSLVCAILALLSPPALAFQENNAPESCGKGSFNLQQAVSDNAQRNTLAFDGFAMMTGNLEAQSFFPPGKLVDYWGFQYLRDNDPNNMGHNTSFLTRAACNVLFILDKNQVDTLKTLGKQQVGPINEYGYKRFALMKAFRRLVDNDLPAGSTGLNREAVRAVSRSLYELDGQLSFERALVFSDIFRSLTPDQKAYLDAMVGKGWASWPDKKETDVRDKTGGLPRDEAVALMTYAGDIFSWYAGCVDADVYFCPERHGTYFGGFYIKDAPAIGRPGYSIDEELTASAGSVLCESSKGYVTPQQAQVMSSLVALQRDNLITGAANIIKIRTDISAALRSLIAPTRPSDATLEKIKATVLENSAKYGELDGDNNYFYATVFAQVKASLSPAQMDKLMALRKSILSGTYADGTAFDFTVCKTPYLFSGVITSLSVLDPYISNTDYLFSSAAVSSFSISNVTLGQAPFSLTITGTGFQSGCKVLVNGQAVPTTVFQSETSLMAKGSGLKTSLPKGTVVQITVQNPDGRVSAPFAFTRS
ncbi:MAG: IPT/TIG domain-containing protein [Blastocatellia bacterium]|nr:IPT/TIG domain-containing protein [Blastocatellia bacterium]